MKFRWDGMHADWPGDRVALVAATLTLLAYGIAGNYEQPDPQHFIALALGIACLTGALRRARWAGLATLAATAALAIVVRAQIGLFDGSDVLAVTAEALRTLHAGVDPYAHVYATSRPPGALFAYPPGELTFYGLWQLATGTVLGADRVAGILDVLAIAALFPLAGAGVAALVIAGYAIVDTVVFHAIDGSNDTAASFFVVLAVVLLTWSLRAAGRPSAVLGWMSAAAFGWGIAFKEYSVLPFFFVMLFLAREHPARVRAYGLDALWVTAAFVLPFFVWNPLGFVQNVGGALLMHKNIWGRNIWRDLLGVTPLSPDLLAVVVPFVMAAAFAAVAFVLFRSPARTLGGALLQGCALFATALVFARWTTSVYYIYLTPLVLTGIVLALAPEGERPPPADARA